MPSIYDLKPKFQGLLRPISDGLAAAGVTANQVTLYAVLLSLLAGGSVAAFPEKQWPLLLIPLALFLRMALNAIDGMLVREHDMKSPLGAILNELGDVISDAALYLPLCWVPEISPVWVVSVVLLAIISEMTGVVAVQIGTERRYDGPMGKSDRAFVFGAVCLLVGLGMNASLWVNYVLAATLVLSGLTIFNRACCALEAVA